MIKAYIRVRVAKTKLITATDAVQVQMLVHSPVCDLATCGVTVNAASSVTNTVAWKACIIIPSKTLELYSLGLCTPRRVSHI